MARASADKTFSAQLLAWHKVHGRTGLPWQNTRDPYRVWLSEIMLQQTQVITVIDYYARFLQRFPTVADLAAAPLDDVLALWAGLGYYSRARNLHACAQAVVSQHAGEFPRSAQLLQTLPGIGPSTAAAIASFCFAQRVAILDGNVKRVLTRLLGFDKDLAIAKHERELLDIANDMLPERDLANKMPRYTQAIMDLGATVCTPRQPACASCPMSQECVASVQGKTQYFPVKTKKLKRSSQSLWLLWAQRKDGSVLLQKRPTPGVWAGLHCLPLFDSLETLEASLSANQRLELKALPAFVHVLTHKDLHLHVMILEKASLLPELGQWVADWRAVGLPAPVKKLLSESFAQENG
ncbi:A/G-specific adenine glycosylase [Variovorax sp. PCZ-1]|uniref:A/G-specific adenine glycosylase n=1 Tax=Variovorax sp. PCZ-1 TaxID=2835533 RepID=UPI001BCC1087|nr:A/G-specific adenine glycosylase [Variovorax sp. PCZ-1]MBS7808516.1 A/G-specific adenine glycosylase [Variovorax sp. PCZ-1]